MGRIHSITAAACATLLIGAAAAVAQPADRSTFVTFSGPVSIPGKTLPAGTYTFRLADSPSDRHIVQIFDKEQTQLFATILAVPAERNEADGEPVITFRETPSDRPPAVRFWYYAGDKSGNEFVYPRSQAMTIARASGEPVMAMDTETGDVNEWKGTPARVIAEAETPATTTAPATTSATAPPTETTEPAAPQPTTTQPPTTEPAESAEPSTAPTPMTSAPDQPAPTASRDQTAGTSGRSEPSELPRTAGELPAVGLIALFAFAGAFALRAARKTAV